MILSLVKFIALQIFTFKAFILHKNNHNFHENRSFDNCMKRTWYALEFILKWYQLYPNSILIDASHC